MGVPTAAVAGPLYAKWIAPRIELAAENPMAAQFVEHGEETSLPGFWTTVATILLPVAMMLVGSSANLVAVPGTSPNNGLRLVGNPDIALLVGAVVSFVTLGR